MKHLFFTVWLLIFTQNGMANETVFSQQYSTCMAKSGGVTIEILDCTATETKKQEFLINKTYKKVIKNLSVKRKDQFRKTQLLWIKYRDANCNFHASPDGGTLATIISTDCFLTESASRRKVLEKILYLNEK